MIINDLDAAVVTIGPLRCGGNTPADDLSTRGGSFRRMVIRLADPPVGGIGALPGKPLIVGYGSDLVRIAGNGNGIGARSGEYLVKMGAVCRLDAVVVECKVQDKGIPAPLL